MKLIRKIERRISFLVFTIILVSFWQAVYASEKELGPSFDCDRALTKVEKSICASKYLSDLDRELGELYRKKRSISEIRSEVKRSQLNWLRNERAKCESEKDVSPSSRMPGIVACLMSAYKNRIQELNDLKASKNLRKVFEYKINKGRQYELCHRYVELMNRVQPNPRSSCDLPYPFDDVALEQGFSEIPWKEVDKNEHEDAIQFYWMRWKNVTEMEMGAKGNKDSYKEFFGNIEHLWRAKIDINFDGHDEIVYRLPSRGQCRYRSLYFIYSSSIPAKYADRSRSRYPGDFFFFNGRVYITYGGSSGSRRSLYEAYGEDYLVREKYVCQFNRITKER